MLRITIFSLIMLLLTTGLIAGNNSIKVYGKVVDEQGRIVAWQTLVLKKEGPTNIKIAVSTDSEGKWNRMLPESGRWALIIKRKGFITYFREFNIVENEQIRIKASLSTPPSIKQKEIRKAVNLKDWKTAINKATIVMDAYYFSREKTIVESTLYWLAYAQGHLADSYSDINRVKELKETAIVNLNYLLEIRAEDSKWFDDAMILRTKFAEQLFNRGERQYLSLIREAEKVYGKDNIYIKLAALDALLRNELVSPDPLMIIAEHHDKNSVRIMAVKILARKLNRRTGSFLTRIYYDKKTPAMVRLAIWQSVMQIENKYRLRLDEPSHLW